MNLTKSIPLVPMMAMAASAGELAAQETQHPNILYIMCDDHAIQCISAYGSALSSLAPTPNIDR
nr:sulfatase [Bacteroidaceae bacterium]